MSPPTHCMLESAPPFHSVKDMMNLSFDPWMILYGLLLVVMMRVRPQGIWGKQENDGKHDEESLPGQEEAGASGTNEKEHRGEF